MLRISLSLIVTPCERSRGGCEWFYTHQKCVVEVTLHFQFELNSLEVVSVGTDKNVKIGIR